MIVREVFMLILFFSATKLMNASLFYISQLLGYRIFRWLFNFSWLFNFTKFWWYKVTYYPGFNPRPTLGTTNTNNTPTNAFQSTPPRGRRPVQIMPVPTLMCFNPRPHTRGDSPHGLPLWLCSVSIHAPTRGATECEWRCVECECVSIHAPTRGAT